MCWSLHNRTFRACLSDRKYRDWLSKYLNDQPFEEMTKQDILSYLNSLRKPTSIDPQQKWIGSYNNRLRYYAKFFRWLYNKEEPDYRKRINPPCFQGLRQLPRQEKSSYKPTLDFKPSEKTLKASMAESAKKVREYFGESGTGKVVQRYLSEGFKKKL